MTSSLVGSEMCIRDSAWAGKRVAERHEFVCIRLRGGAGFRKGGRHRPVSYTHLTLPTICSV
eukprot:11172034-Prorocentrum_lima.AAC.1